MEALALFGICFLGTVIAPGQPELATMFYAGELGWHPLPIALVAAAGQCASYAGLYLGGDQLFSRWAFVRRPVERVRERYGEQLTRNFLGLGLLAGSLGVPPAVGIAVLASGFKVPLVKLVAVLFVSRAARFVVLAVFGQQLGLWWDELTA